MFFYYQKNSGAEPWTVIPAAQLAEITRTIKPMLVTALSVNKVVEDVPNDQHDKLQYSGPLYIDWDGPDLNTVIPQVHAFMGKLEAMGVDLATCAWYATGGKGFHCEIPEALFMEKPNRTGVQLLPIIYKEMVISQELYVDTIDLRVYSARRGRMWRQVNVLRPDRGTYKVPLSVQELRELTFDGYHQMVSGPRNSVPLAASFMNTGLAILYARALQKVTETLKARAKRKKDPQAKTRATCTSVEMMMSGFGIKAGVGFHQLALQIAIIANTAGWTEEKMVEQCADLISGWAGDGNRYNTPAKRRDELVRMHRYANDNPLYEFSVGAIKVLLEHAAPDLDGVPITAEDVRAGVEEAKEQAEAKKGEMGVADATPDEFNDVAGGVTLSKFGVYVPDEAGGKRRICAVSFSDIHLLMSTDTGMISAYEAMILVNGKEVGRQTLEMDTFQSLQFFNRFVQRLGHAMQGTDAHLRGLFMRFIELAKKKGRQMYIAKREGLDLVNIPNHDDPDLREPFMIWADGRSVLLDPRIERKKVTNKDFKLDISFQGFPDPRGLFKTDLADAPKLGAWLESQTNKAALKVTLQNLFTCQKPDVLSKMIGWYTACFYRMLFHRAYNKFPLLHVNGAAGSGKTECNRTLANLFYYNQDPKMLTPASSLFAITQHMSASVSLPLLLDEYKPHEMGVELHNRMKLLFRDAYNARDINKGGGNRESDDYRILSHTQLVAPLVFIAEAAEEEAAVAERVVLVTMVKPSSTLSLKWLARYQIVDRNKKHLSVLGQFLASETINTMSIEKLREEFDPLFEEARNRFMLTEADLLDNTLDERTLSMKQGAKERNVYNFTVARFGLQRFKRVVDMIFGEEEFADSFKELDDAVYTRLNDLQASTQAEWAKVLDNMAGMSYSVDSDTPYALRRGKEYEIVNDGGVDVLEIALSDCYFKYRGYMRSTSSRPLFLGVQSFLQAMKDCPALIEHGYGKQLQRPGVFRLNIPELSRLKVGEFK